MIAAADVLAFAGEGEGEVAAAAPEVVVNWALEVADAGGAGLVSAEGGGFGGWVRAVGLEGCGGGGGVDCFDWRRGDVVADVGGGRGCGYGGRRCG